MKANINENAVQSLNIDLGGVKLAVNGDENRIISFNPDDIGFAERFYGLISKVDEYEKKYTEEAANLEKDDERDEYGIPKNQKERLNMYNKICSELRSDIDDIFGAHTSEKVFGSTNTLEMFTVFFEAITPFVEKSRKGKIQKYTKASGGKAVIK